MKKVLSVVSSKSITLSQNAYIHMAEFSSPSLATSALCQICYKNLSKKIQNQGLFYEGKLNANNNQSYFHWLYFDPKNVNFELDLDRNLEKFAKAQNKNIPKGITNTIEFDQINEQMKKECGFSFFESLGIGKTETELIKEAKIGKNIVLLSDFSNYPYNEGFFLIHNGRMLSNGTKKIKSGKYWFITKEKNSNKISHQILTLKDNDSIEENIKNIDFAFSLNPIIVDNKIMTDIADIIPKTRETFIHSWRGGNSHIIQENITEINQQLMSMIDNSQYEVDPKLKDILKEKNNLLVASDITDEKLNTWFAWENGTFPYQAGVKGKLKTGQYYFDKSNKLFYTRLKRANFGHSMFALTKSGKLIVFKIFNTEEKNNGLLIEQLGTALAKISRTMLNENGINDQIVFAGVGANGGDVRSFLGLNDAPGFKNIPEDNTLARLQEKLSIKTAKPLYFKVITK